MTTGGGGGNDESMCKRYKLEDQLSDIQYIDCSTPEHTINNPNTIYASVQIHNPPASSQSSELNADSSEFQTDTVFDGVNRSAVGTSCRYSYPGTKFRDTEQHAKCFKEERFSYPGMGKKFVEDKKYICRVPVNETVIRGGNGCTQTQRKQIGRFSYCDTVPGINGILRSSSAEMSKKSEMERSKLSIATPTTPSRSPRYSLLVGETSSENSSSLNTPIYDMDISGAGSLLVHPDDSQTIDSSKQNMFGGCGSSSSSHHYDTKDFTQSQSNEKTINVSCNIYFRAKLS